MAASLRRWIFILLAVAIFLFMFNRWVVIHMFGDIWRAKVLRFQMSCVIVLLIGVVALFNWVNLCTLFDTVKVNKDSEDGSIDWRRPLFHVSIQWRDLRANWGQYTVKAAVWRGFLITVMLLSQLAYSSFSFLITSSPDPYPLAILLFLCLAFTIQLFTALVTLHIVKFLMKLASKSTLLLARKKSKLPRIFIVVYALFVVIVGHYNALQTPEIKQSYIHVKGLPNHLDKMTITFVSDIHLGPTVGRRSLEKIVHVINYLYSDVVVIGGDLVDGRVDQLESAVESLSWIKSKYGTYFVTGNHEYYTGDVHNWFKELESLGVKILHNTNVKLKGDGDSSICLAGVDDPTADTFRFMDHTMDIDGALRTCDTSLPVILIAHQPKAAKAAFQSGHRVDLVLSGHTHGGQMFPFMISAYLFNPYYSGLYKVGEHSHVYVSTGAMYWGMPVRFGTQQEITKITLLNKD